MSSFDYWKDPNLGRDMAEAHARQTSDESAQLVRSLEKRVAELERRVSILTQRSYSKYNGR